MRPAACRRAVLIAGIGALVTVSLPALAEHPVGSCPPVPTERCERWSVTIDDATADSSARSDQFSVGTFANATTVVAVVKDVSFNTASPYDSSGKSMLVAYDRTTGAQRWVVRRADRTYLSPHAGALSPDGSTLFVTGAAYNGYPVGASDSRIATTAY